MSKLHDSVREEGLEAAKGARFMGEPLEGYSREDLLAIAALGWNAYAKTFSDRRTVEKEG